MMDTFDSQNSVPLEDRKEYHYRRDGTLFLIDGTESSFRQNARRNISYFQIFIEKYMDILRHKLLWNKSDWMGVMLFGTKEWNKDPEIKNILTIQNFSQINLQKLREIKEIVDNEGWKRYRDIACTKEYPLYDALFHSIYMFSNVTISMPVRRVVLLTCLDDPPISNDEKHRIRVHMKSFKKFEVQLSVFGLKKTWDRNVFYKDLEMIANDISELDYAPMHFRDLSGTIQRPSKIIAKLPWRFSKNVVLDVVVATICCKTQYLKKIKVNKATNKPLTTYTYHTVVRNYNRDSDDDDEEEMSQADDKNSSVVIDSDIRKIQKYGNRILSFTPKEVKNLSHMCDRGIDVIGTKPINIDPMYHYKPAYLVTPASSTREDNKLLFSHLLNKCTSKGLMIICGVTLRNYSAKNLYTMIPVEEKGGFYLYALPARENVRKDPHENLHKYIYTKDNEPKPVGTELLSNAINRLRIEYHPKLFPNPKLKVQQQNVETLALDLPLGDRPSDDTLPRVDAMRENAGDILKEYMEMIEYTQPEPSTSRKRRKLDCEISAEMESQILNYAKTDKLQLCSVPELKSFLRSRHAKVSGTKGELIARIKSMV